MGGNHQPDDHRLFQPEGVAAEASRKIGPAPRPAGVAGIAGVPSDPVMRLDSGEMVNTG